MAAPNSKPASSANVDAEASTSPPRSPELNGSVERNNGAWRYEFYATRDLPDDSRYGDGRAFPEAAATDPPHRSGPK